MRVRVGLTSCGFVSNYRVGSKIVSPLIDDFQIYSLFDWHANFDQILVKKLFCLFVVGLDFRNYLKGLIYFMEKSLRLYTNRIDTS